MRKLILAVALVASAAVSQSVTDARRAAVMAEQTGDAPAALAAAARLENSGDFADRSLALQIRAQFLPATEVLKLPEPTSDQLLLHQIWRALRIEALARGSQLDQARDELMLMRKEGHRDKFYGNEPPQLRIAQHLAVARINFAAKNYRGAAQRFARAAEVEAKAEGPIWHQPLDSALGASLLKAGPIRRSGVRLPASRTMSGRCGAAPRLRPRSATPRRVPRRWSKSPGSGKATRRC